MEFTVLYLTALVAVVIAGYVLVTTQRLWLRSRVHKHVLVQTDDATYEGDLWSVHRDGLVLVNAQLVGQGPLPGETFVPRDAVKLVQRVDRPR